jgi:hypothetical protein
LIRAKTSAAAPVADSGVGVGMRGDTVTLLCWRHRIYMYAK